MKESLLRYLAQLHRDYPYPEREDFYAKSTHSQHRLKAQHIFCLITEAPRDIGVMLNRIFIVGYALSAVFAEMTYTDGIVTAFWGSGHAKWFHGPFLGGLDTLRSQLMGDIMWVSVGGVITKEELSSDQALGKALAEYAKFRDEVFGNAWKKTVDGEFERDGGGNCIRVPEGVTHFNEQIPSLHKTLKGIYESLVVEAISMVKKL